MLNNTPILEFKGVTKIYPGTVALKDFSMSMNHGEVLGLVGKNGAGKSTLLKILLGAIESTAGEIFLSGKRLKGGPQQIRKMGVSMVYQALNLAPHLTVEENIFLGREFTWKGKWFNIVHHGKQKQKIQKLIDSIGINLDLNARLCTLKIDARQLVAIIRAVSLNAKVIALDEPTSSLSRGETEKLFKNKGVSFIFVSHHLNEVFEITDRVAILKDGTLQGVRNTPDIDIQDMTAMMLGKDTAAAHEQMTSAKIKTNRAQPSKNPLLRVENLTRNNHFSDISFDLFEKEILGITGLMGSGKSELAEALCGASPLHKGQIFLHGKKVRLDSPTQAIHSGVAYLPPDRLGEGIFEKMSVGENIIIGNTSKISNHGVTNKKRQLTIGKQYIDEFNIKTIGYCQPISALSGGNQQKALFARLLNTQCNILILNEPTQGIDVMIKEEIFRIMMTFVNAAPGRAIIMVSGEVPEIVSACSRVLVMKSGEVVETMPGDEAMEMSVLNAMI